MEIVTYIWKGFVMGLCASAPIGPVALMAISKSLNEGRRSGFYCGLGGAVTDTTYAAVVAFAISFLHQFIQQHTSWIELIGGLIIMYLGWTMLHAQPRMAEDGSTAVTRKEYGVYFLKATVTGLSNAGALFIMFALFASFGLSQARPFWASCLVVASLFAGAVSYWAVMSFLLSKLHRFVQLRHVLWINRLAGLGVIGFGLYLLIRSL